MQLRNGFMKITWLLMLRSVISCVLEKIQEMKTQRFSNEEQQRTKILEVTIDNKLTFKRDIKSLCKKASQK